MFVLGGNSFPTSQDEFVQSLNEGLLVFGQVPGVRELSVGTFPEIPRLEVDLTGGLAGKQTRPGARTGTVRQGVRIQALTICANPLRLPESQIDFHFEARNVALDYDRSTAEERPILVMTFAESGRITVSTSKLHFESLALALARKAAAKQDVIIEGIGITLSSRGSRDLAFKAVITARKMIFAVKIEATGRIHLDNQLMAHISGLDCSGEGMVNAGAAELLKPHLLKMNGKSFPLSALPLGNVCIHDVAVHTHGEPICIEAEFGTA